VSLRYAALFFVDMKAGPLRKESVRSRLRFDPGSEIRPPKARGYNGYVDKN
jgi:hypothetical protein